MLCNSRKFGPLFAVALCVVITASADKLAAQQVEFSGWKHQKFSLLGGNIWRQQGEELSVDSDGTVSLIWQALPEGSRKAGTATWRWSVEQGVPPTDLNQKGGDDRNLSLYAIFVPPDAVPTAEGQGIRRLLENPDVRVLMYVWGGAHQRGALLSSPYLGTRGKTIVVQPAGEGQHEEKVDLRSDLKRAFGISDLALVGLAVSADSDDTDTKIRARIGNLRLSD
jgi:hypothetical protein